MKTSSLLLNSAIAGMILSGAQAFAATTNFSETIPNIDYEIEGQTYKGTFTDANLKSSTGAVFNNTKETITSGTVDLTILNDTSLPVTLTIDGISQNLTPTYSGETLAYTLTSAEDSYIQGLDGTFNYSVVVDCGLASAGLTVSAGSTPNTSGAPDAASTSLLLGGVMAALGLAKRKLA